MEKLARFVEGEGKDASELDEAVADYMVQLASEGGTEEEVWSVLEGCFPELEEVGAQKFKRDFSPVSPTYSGQNTVSRLPILRSWPRYKCIELWLPAPGIMQRKTAHHIACTEKSHPNRQTFLLRGPPAPLQTRFSSLSCCCGRKAFDFPPLSKTDLFCVFRRPAC